MQQGQRTFRISRHWWRSSTRWFNRSYQKANRWPGRFVELADHWWRTRKRRYDRGPVYMAMILALWFTSISMILIGPVPDSSISELSSSTQRMLSISLFLGSSICLIGASSGSRYFLDSWKITKSYQWAIIGMPFIATSIGFYGYAVYVHTPNWASALGATLAPLLGMGGCFNSIFIWLESRRIEANVATITAREEQ